MRLRRILRPSPAAATAVLALAIACGGVALAAIPDSAGVIHGCYADDTGALRVFDTAAAGRPCSNTETALSWNQKGVPGPQGPAGPRGPSFAIGRFHNGSINLGKKGDTFTVAQLRVPAPGFYAVTAKLVRANGYKITCVLKATYYGEQDVSYSDFYMARPDDADVISLQLLAAFPELPFEPAGGLITLRCHTGPGFPSSTKVKHVKLMAIALGGYTNTAF
jgi:hypothetical protein